MLVLFIDALIIIIFSDDRCNYYLMALLFIIDICDIDIYRYCLTKISQ